MEIEIKLPTLSEETGEGVIEEWVKKEGDAIEKGDVLLKVESEKVSMEIESEYSGRLTRIVAREGDVVEWGETVAYLEA